MRFIKYLCFACLPCFIWLTACTNIQSSRTLVVAHRGASGYLPEHTLEAYAAAYFMGADLIEPDLVATRDGYIICFHDLYLERVTDVENKFPNRMRSDGHWYAIDFDMSEIQSLTVQGRGDQPWDGFQIPTFEQMLSLIDRLNQQTGGSVGVIPELKDPAFHADEGVNLAYQAIEIVEQTGWDQRECFIQCFQPDTLIALHEQFGNRFALVQLISDIDNVPSLENIAVYATGVGPSRKVIDADPSFVERAQALGLVVIPYTFNNDPDTLDQYIHSYGVDGVFANYPELAKSIVVNP